MKYNFLIKIFVALFLFLFFLIIPNFNGLDDRAMKTLSIAVLIIFLWFTEAIPLFVTGLLPMVLLPIMGVESIKVVTPSYANNLIFLFLSGFIIAQAMQFRNLHQRIAFNILTKFGTSPVMLVLGFLLVSQLLSMWLSNTATATMLFPVVISILMVLQQIKGDEVKNLEVPLLLAIAYGASIGGVATLIGTPPNAVLAGYVDKIYGYSIGFLQWMKIGVPISFILIILLWVYLIVFFKLKNKKIGEITEKIEHERKNLGRYSYPEKVVSVIFGFVVLGWVFRASLNKWFGLHLNDTSIGMLGAFLVFTYPIKLKDKIEFLLPAENIKKLPWNVLLIFGGGLALGQAFKDTGISTWIASKMSFLEAFPLLFIIFAVTFVLVFLTELTSNTATAATFVPLISSMAIKMNQDIFLLLIPMTIGLSCAFMLPAATPPNAIIFGSNRITVRDMAKVGFFFNLISALVVTLVSYVLINYAFGTVENIVPTWQMLKK